MREEPRVVLHKAMEEKDSVVECVDLSSEPERFEKRESQTEDECGA